jgi:hypothetical protein
MYFRCLRSFFFLFIVLILIKNSLSFCCLFLFFAYFFELNYKQEINRWIINLFHEKIKILLKISFLKIISNVFNLFINKFIDNIINLFVLSNRNFDCHHLDVLTGLTNILIISINIRVPKWNNHEVTLFIFLQ